MNRCDITRFAVLVLLAAGFTGCQATNALRSEHFPETGSSETPFQGKDYAAPCSQTLSTEGEADKADSAKRAPISLTPARNREPVEIATDQKSAICTTSHTQDILPTNWSEENVTSNESCLPCGFHSKDQLARMTPREVFQQDCRDFFPMLARDAKGLVNWYDMALLGSALGGAIAVRETDLDDEVRDYTFEHPDRWGKGSEYLGNIGEVQYQVPVLLGVYGYSLYAEDEELGDLSRSILSAYTLTGLSTLSIKAIANTERPSRVWNDGQYGFPSFHTSSSFSVAAVVDEYYGMGKALPVYALAGLIGWSRIDERDHDLSDVLFGAALGYVIGKSVARQHRNRDSQLRFVPYSHPLEPANGLGAEVRF